jgi:hypothetical protein
VTGWEILPELSCSQITEQSMIAFFILATAIAAEADSTSPDNQKDDVGSQGWFLPRAEEPLSEKDRAAQDALTTAEALPNVTSPTASKNLRYSLWAVSGVAALSTGGLVQRASEYFTLASETSGSSYYGYLDSYKKDLRSAGILAAVSIGTAIAAAKMGKTADTPEKPSPSDASNEGDKEAPAKEAPAKEAPAKEAPVKEAPVKEAPAKEDPAKEAPAKEASVKERPAKEEPADKEIDIFEEQLKNKKESKEESKEDEEYDVNDLFEDTDP